VYVFCVTRRPAAFLSLVGTNQRIVHDTYMGRLIALKQPELNRLLEIEAANLYEQGGKIAFQLEKLRRSNISELAKSHLANRSRDQASEHMKSPILRYRNEAGRAP